jgi:hypothetical protein
MDKSSIYFEDWSYFELLQIIKIEHLYSFNIKAFTD